MNKEELNEEKKGTKKASAKKGRPTLPKVSVQTKLIHYLKRAIASSVSSREPRAE